VADSKAFERLKAEFSKMAQAPDVIRAKSNNPAFVAEVEPWLIQFESLGKAGLNSMQMLEATEAGNSSAALNYAMEAACLLAAVVAVTRVLTGVHYPSDVLAGLAFGAGAAVIGFLL